MDIPFGFFHPKTRDVVGHCSDSNPAVDERAGHKSCVARRQGVIPLHVRRLQHLTQEALTLPVEQVHQLRTVHRLHTAPAVISRSGGRRCRYFSGFFQHHPLLADFDYFWRVEPEVDFLCNLTADPFVQMQQRCVPCVHDTCLNDHASPVTADSARFYSWQMSRLTRPDLSGRVPVGRCARAAALATTVSVCLHTSGMPWKGRQHGAGASSTASRWRSARRGRRCQRCGIRRVHSWQRTPSWYPSRLHGAARAFE